MPRSPAAPIPAAKPERRFGLLMHPTSLPSPHGIGDLGAEARSFLDWLAASGGRLWQVMPLGPTGYGNSPYAALSAFAGNPAMIDLRPLVARGWLKAEEIQGLTELPRDKVDFCEAPKQKRALLSTAWARFAAQHDPAERHAFHEFCASHASWLEDYARFEALKAANGDKPWVDWDPALASRDPAALAEADRSLGEGIGAAKFSQWLFFVQWHQLKNYANERGIAVVGDVPIFVAHDSADVWAAQELYFLDHDGKPTVVAGVPPDYFSETGQLWGNPLYRWKLMEERGYDWWRARMRLSMEMVDVIRIDHFRGFEAYWEIPAGSANAIGGRWVIGPGAGFFQSLVDHFGELPLIAEDLGLITEPVRQLRDAFGLPGMKVLQFAFGSDPTNEYLPHNHIANSVIYLGTHDNDTTVGWLTVAEAKERESLQGYLGLAAESSREELCWALIRSGMASVAETFIAMPQDLLGLGSSARINTPSEPEGNWDWRLEAGALDGALAAQLRALAKTYARLPKSELVPAE